MQKEFMVTSVVCKVSEFVLLNILNREALECSIDYNV